MSTARRDREQIAAAIGFQHQDARQAQAGAADRQRIAELELQQARELGLGPCFAARRAVGDRLRWRVAGIGNQQLPAQGIGVVDRLQLYQLQLFAFAHHAAHGRHARMFEAERSGGRHIFFGRWCAAQKREIACQQGARFGHQRAVDTRHQQTDGDGACHRDDGRRQHHGETTAGEIAAQQAPRQAPQRQRAQTRITQAGDRRPAPDAARNSPRAPGRG